MASYVDNDSSDADSSWSVGRSLRRHWRGHDMPMLKIFTEGGQNGPLIAVFGDGAGMSYYFVGARWNQQFRALQMLKNAMATGRRDLVVEAMDSGNVLKNVGGLNSTQG